MNKEFRLVLVALAAVFAFGALTAASASALTFLLALWLWNGVAASEALNVESEDELLYEDIKGGLFGEPVAFLCSRILVGTVNPESLGYISELLDLTSPTKVLISEASLTEPGLACTNVAGCPTPLVWAVNLPWETEVELVEDAGTFFALLILPHPGGNNPGWMVQCMGIIGEPEDECTVPEATLQLTLEGATLLSSYTEAFRELVGAPLVACTRGGAGTGLAVSDEPFGVIRHETGGELSASSETSEA